MKHSSAKPATVVAVVNSSADVVEALQMLLQEEGYNTVGGHVSDFKRGKQDLLKFFADHKPRVVIWDIAPPYTENWNYLQQVRSIPFIKKKKFIITSTNVEKLKEVAGDISAIELVGKPFDLNKIIQLVKQM